MKIWPLLLTSVICVSANAEPNPHNGPSNSYYYIDGEEEFEGFYGDEDFVEIATGSKKSLAKVPSVASLITDSEIAAMGARTLSEVLATVPGLHVSHSGQLYAPRFVIRGISSADNPQTLMMINGVPISSVVRGDRQIVFADFPAEVIARIEVIRGPGSALHGADAFAGVINIITKGVEDIHDSLVGARVGSFDTSDVWAQTAMQFGELNVSAMMYHTSTDGHDGVLTSDAQTNLDAIFSQFGAPAVSKAPGSVNVGYRSFDTRIEAQYRNWYLNFGFNDIDNMGSGQGVAQALDPDGKFGSEKLLIKMGYQEQLTDDWNVDIKYSHYRSNQRVEENLLLFPKGAFGGAFINGFIGNPETKEKNEIYQGTFGYSGISKHLITFGIGYREEDLYSVTESKNFTPNFEPLDELIETTDTPAVFIPEAKRHNTYAFIQDEFQLAPDWELTAGLRYDDYSAFGSTVNPRLALVWASDRNLSTKFLYGRAFRVPSVGERLIVNNPVSLGNPDLEPETIDTVETAFNYQINAELHLDLNIYYFKIDDFIALLPDEGKPTNTAQNVGKLEGSGLEMEFRYKPSNVLDFKFNYAYQQVEDRDTGVSLGGTPIHQYYAQVDWSMNKSAYLSFQLKHIGKVSRASIDSRNPLKSYTNATVALSFENIFEGMDMKMRLDNIFDEDIRDPSNADISGEVAIPNDLPQAGRTFYVGLSKTFK